MYFTYFETEVISSLTSEIVRLYRKRWEGHCIPFSPGNQAYRNSCISASKCI